MQHRGIRNWILNFLFVLLVSFVVHLPCGAGPLRVGAYVQDVSPTTFPVIINGGFAEGHAEKIIDPPHARAFVLEDGKEKIAIVIVDSCMIPRELLDDAKERARKLTGIATDRMLISATHSHSVPSSMACLGSDADANYVKILPGLLARAIDEANKRLAPARIGWTVINDPEHTAVRRWIFRPDRMRKDPFGELTVRANMHPGYLSPDAVGPTGPIDPGLSVIAIQYADGRPMGLIANYSMHYFGASPVSADYYGKFCAKVSEKLAPGDKDFVAAMSQGTSGDIWLADYSKPAPKEKRDIEVYSQAIADEVAEAVGKNEKTKNLRPGEAAGGIQSAAIQYSSDVPIAMKETTLKLRRRVPDEKRLAWAKEKVAAFNAAAEKAGGAVPIKPKLQPDVYAREAIMLHDEPERELKLQAIRIGDLAIAAIPNEVFALTGLKLKAMSPLPMTVNIELANGAEGYIPPPEQHKLGGYTTWPARTAGLEEQAEPKIVEGVLKLMEAVSGARRKTPVEGMGDYAKAVMASKPAAYWRMAEMSGPFCADITGNGLTGIYEAGVVFYLPGAVGGAAGDAITGDAITGDAARPSRAAHFAGGRLAIAPMELKLPYSVEFFAWNGMAAEARPVAAYLFSRGKKGDQDGDGDHLGIGGNIEGGANAGKLIFYNGSGRKQLLAGKTIMTPREWYHIAMARDGKRVRAWVNGNLEIDADAEVTSDTEDFFFGGRCDNFANLEGKLDEISFYRRALLTDEVAGHFKAAALPAPKEAGAKAGGTTGGSARSATATGTATAVSTAAVDSTPAGQGAGLRKRASEPLSPAESMAKIHVAPEMVVELVAAEPLVVDPVAIDWGADGKLWVVEMADYPYGMDGKGAPGGRIKYLEDTDGDGKYDKATLFMDHIQMPNGILAWKKGVIVTAAPEVFYAEDTDGDGKADKKEVLYSGFKAGNPQLRCNGLRWGLDNWVYIANGWSAGIVKSARTGKTLDIKGHDLRIRPDTGEMELVSGWCQFGREQDDRGRWFGTDNSHPLFYFALEERYLQKNPNISIPDARAQLLPLPLPPVFPKSAFARRYIGLDHHGHFTSACGISVWRDEVEGSGFGVQGSGQKREARIEKRDDARNSQLATRNASDATRNSSVHAFICEPVHNLVQHQALVENGSTFSATRVDGEKGADWVAGEDPWFRPVMTRCGPDGALWVVDMYRYMIEHPDWLNEVGKKELAPFYRDGDDRGRIYRVYPKARPPRALARLDKASIEELVKALESPSGFTRDLAQRLLIWSPDEKAMRLLRRMALESKNPLARLHALCAMDGLTGMIDHTGPHKVESLDAELILAAMKDADAGVRMQGARLAEGWVNDRPESAAVVEALAKLAADENASVRVRAIYALGLCVDDHARAAADAVAAAAVKHADDAYETAAALGTISQHVFPDISTNGLDGRRLLTPHFEALVKAAVAARVAPDSTLYQNLLIVAAAGRNRQASAELLAPITTPSPEGFTPAQIRAAGRWMDAMAGRHLSIVDFLGSNGAIGKGKEMQTLAPLFDHAARAAGDEKATPDDRQAATELLGRLPERKAADLKIIGALLSPQTPAEVQVAAVKAAGRTGDPSVPAFLLAGWAGHGPPLRTAIADALFTRETWLADFAKHPAARDLDFSRKQRLLNHKSPAIREAAKTNLASAAAGADRQKVIDEYAPSLTMPGDAKRGQTLYAEQCATCHKVGAATLSADGKPLGHDLGPNLLTVRDWTRESLLTAILDPDRTVAPQFMSYIATLADGHQITGLIAAESAGSISIRQLDDTTVQVARASLKSLVSTGHSLMPQGFESALSAKDLADLMAFVTDAERR